MAIVIAAFLVALIPPHNAHAVHTSGATQLTPSRYVAEPRDGSLGAGQSAAGESIDAVLCAAWRGTYARRNVPCNPADPRWPSYPGAVQTSHTLYLTWYGCIAWHGAGAIVPWEGYNFEYLPASRTVVVHCYKSTPYLYFPDRLYGIAGFPDPDLIAISDGSFGPGPITINEDDRLEHLVGDQAWADFQLATATIG